MAKKIKKPNYDRFSGGVKLSSSFVAQKKDSISNEHPLFCLHYLQNLNDCQKNDKVALLKTLFKLSQLTWKEIYASGKHQFGFEKIKRRGIKGIQFPPEVITDDVQSLDVFRFHDKKPMMGLISGKTYHLIYLDLKMNAYDHGS